jgi:hypothetical protein
MRFCDKNFVHGGPVSGSEALHCFSKFILISEMLQFHAYLNIGDFNIKFSFNMKFITASLDPYNMHEGAFKSIWDSILLRLLFPKPSFS